MSAKTSIAWCDATWNPTVGCSRVSSGCEHCYAERQAHRFHGIEGHALEGLTEGGKHGPRWNGVVRLNPKALDLPLRWRKPRRIFVNSMSDLFHEKLTDEQIDRVFAVMALAPQHTFQILTKRPERMRAYMTGDRSDILDLVFDAVGVERGDIAARVAVENLECSWPLSNVWLGVSVEDQKTADERIPLLLQTPAAKRFVSAEPLLGPVHLSPYLPHDFNREPHCPWCESCIPVSPKHDWWKQTREEQHGPFLDWVIVGGESGPGARPCDISWIRSTVEQCKVAGIACFVKQLGSYPILDPRYDRSISGATRKLRARKGDEPEEWPLDLQGVQEFPS